MVMWGIAVTWRPSSSVVVVIIRVVVVVVCKISHFFYETTGQNDITLGRKCLLDGHLKSKRYTKEIRALFRQKGSCQFWESSLKPLRQLWNQTWHEYLFNGSPKYVCFCLLIGSTQNKQEVQRCQKGRFVCGAFSNNLTVAKM
jgi:hypothetical protein